MKQMCNGDSQKWISSLKESHFGEKGRGRLFDTLFTLRQFKNTKNSSYLFQGSGLSSLLCVYPTDAQLREYDKGTFKTICDGATAHLFEFCLQFRTRPKLLLSARSLSLVLSHTHAHTTEKVSISNISLLPHSFARIALVMKTCSLN